MQFYKNLMKEIVEESRTIIGEVKNPVDKFNMNMKLAEAINETMKLYCSSKTIGEPITYTCNNNTEIAEVTDTDKAFDNPLDKKMYEKTLGYKISKKAYDEYVDIFNRRLNGEVINTWIPDEEGLLTQPENTIITLAVKENPLYKDLFNKEDKDTKKDSKKKDKKKETKTEVEKENIVIEEDTVEEEQTVEIDKTPDETTIEEVVEEVLEDNTDNGEVIDIDSETETETEIEEIPICISADINGVETDITNEYNIIKSLNDSLTYDEKVERAVDWIEYQVNLNTYNTLKFIKDKNAEVIQCKTYLSYYLDQMPVEDIVYYINHFASNIGVDEETGEEVYINEEIQLEFLNEENIGAFLEYLQQNQ